MLKTAVSESFHAIVISAYKDQAITAFEYGVLDFVPKPFSQDRLAQAINRSKTRERPDNQTRYLAVKQSMAAKGLSVLRVDQTLEQTHPFRLMALIDLILERLAVMLVANN